MGWTDPGIVGCSLLAIARRGSYSSSDAPASAALVPNDVLENARSPACLATLLMSAIFFAALLYLPQFMTKVLGYSAARSGAGLLPMMATFAVTSFVAGPLYDRMGPKIVVIGGVALLHWGCSCCRSSAPSRLRDLVPGMVVARHRRRALLLVESRRRQSRRSTRRGRASPAASSTCARSPAAPSASGSTPRSS